MHGIKRSKLVSDWVYFIGSDDFGFLIQLQN